MKNIAISTDRVKAQLQRELETADGFQRNIDNALKLMRRISFGDSVESYVKGIGYNTQMQNLCMERAHAVLEALGLIEEDEELEPARLRALTERL